MNVIDQDGFLFGKINVIDALSAILIIAIAVGGSFVAVNPLTATTTTVDATAQASVPPYVADSIQDQTVTNEEITIQGIETTGTEYIETTSEDGTTQFRQHTTLTLSLAIDATQNSEGELRYGNDRLLIDRVITLDFGVALVDATITSIQAGGQR